MSFEIIETKTAPPLQGNSSELILKTPLPAWFKTKNKTQPLCPGLCFGHSFGPLDINRKLERGDTFFHWGFDGWFVYNLWGHFPYRAYNSILCSWHTGLIYFNDLYCPNLWFKGVEHGRILRWKGELVFGDAGKRVSSCVVGFALPSGEFWIPRKQLYGHTFMFRILVSCLRKLPWMVFLFDICFFYQGNRGSWDLSAFSTPKLKNIYSERPVGY